MSRRTSFIIATIFLSIVLLGVEWQAEARFRDSESVALYFLDVGQGDATLIRDGEGRTILIDAGPGDKVLEALERKLPAWERDIDILVITHLDADHFTGTFGLLKRYRIGEIWWNGAAPSTQGGRKLLETFRVEKIPMKVVMTGERLEFPQMMLSVIHPDKSLTDVFVSDKNAESVSVRLDCGEESALIAGDAPSETEQDFLDDRDIESIDLLKVSHHGSKHSTSRTFLEAIAPKYAVISSGKENRYGHPASRVLTDLRKQSIEILRTDTSGDISFLCDGEGFSPS